MEENTVLCPGKAYCFTIELESNDIRLDNFITQQFPKYSRSLFKRLIEQKCVTINDKVATKAGALLKEKDEIVMTIPFPKKKAVLTKQEADKLGVALLHEEKDFAIIHKPAGLVTHAPHMESEELSLVDWILSHFSKIEGVGYEDRPGIVHRLDKQTSGLMVIPLTKEAHSIFSDMFKDRTIHKTYLAVVHGNTEPEGLINFPIARHRTVRNKMAHVVGGRESITRFKAKQYFDEHTLVEVYPETGRTHQIRVHFSRLGHPLVSDSMYGKASPLIKRQALHATEIKFTYKNEEKHFKAPEPKDFLKLLKTLEKKSSKD
jgi:23S rRNA pseudouridine1911/1915/1917 synthase